MADERIPQNSTAWRSFYKRSGLQQRRPEGGHHITIMAPILPPKSGDRHVDIVELTRRFSQILEDRIRQQPADWNWWHRRWRRPPLPNVDLDAAVPHAVAST